MGGLPSLPGHAELIARLGPRREEWDPDLRPETLEPVGAGQESVWDYPRPPRVRQTAERVTVRAGHELVASSDRALNVIETAGAPVHYVPPDDVCATLVPTDHVTLCEWKGAGVHHDVVVGGRRIRHAAFSYPDPLTDLGRGFERIAGWFGFYPARLACFIADERVSAQPGGVYAGWVTSRTRGPIKGAPGTEDW